MNSKPAADQIDRAFSMGALPSRMDQFIETAVPQTFRPFAKTFQTPEGQNFYSASQSVLPYQLIAQSGAAVSEQEYARKMAELVPVAGEDPGVTARKRQQFQIGTEALKMLAQPNINAEQAQQAKTALEGAFRTPVTPAPTPGAQPAPGVPATPIAAPAPTAPVDGGFKILKVE